MITDFNFSISANTLYSGTISLVSSVLYNYPQYIDNPVLQEPNNTLLSDKVTTNTAFDDLLTTCSQPFKKDFTFIKSGRIGTSGANMSKARGYYIVKQTTFTWVLKESQFFIMQGFFHEYGKFKEFGYNGISYRFTNDTMDYNKSNTGLYTIILTIESVLE